MKFPRSIVLVAGLSLAACSSPTHQTQTSTTSASSEMLTLHVIESSGGAWGASKQARVAMESLEGIDRMMMSGRRATLILEKGAKLSEETVSAALKKNGLKFESMKEHKVGRAAAAYVAKTPKFTWATTAQKVRATLLKDLAGVQDVFCGTETVVHMKKGSKALAPEVIEKALKGMKVAVEDVKRDDTAVL